MLKPDKLSPWLYGTILFISALYCIYIWWLPGFYPDYIHSWTQSDRLAIALRYAEGDGNFFLPRTFNLSTPGGITAVDLPLSEYIVSLLMRLLNTHDPAVFRFYCLATGMLASVCLFKTTYRFTGSPQKASLVVLGVFLSPVVFYYGFSFIPSVFAFNYFIFALFFATGNGSRSGIIWAVVFIALAALVRISFLPVFAAFLACLYIHLKRAHRNNISIYRLAVICSLLLIAAWQLYRTHLTRKFGTQFLDRPLPAQSISEFISIIVDAAKRWFSQYFSLLFYIMTIVCLFFYKKDKERLLPFFLPLSMAAGIVVFIALARQFTNHEYYFFESFAPATVILLIYAVAGLDISKRFQAVSFAMALTATVIISSFIIIQKNKPDHYNREHASYVNFKGSEQLLDKYGIPRHAKVLVFNAYTTNLPLIQMNREGYVVFDKEEKNIMPVMSFPYDYIVIQDEFFPTEVLYHYPGLSQNLTRTGGNGRISIFRFVPKRDSAIALPALLGLDDRDTTSFNLANDTGNWINKTGNNNYSEMFSPTLELSKKAFKDRTKIILRFDYNCQTEIPAKIVCAAMLQGKTVWYYDYPVVLSPSKTSVSSLFNIPLTGFDNAVTLRLYLWNEQKLEIKYIDISAQLY